MMGQGGDRMEERIYNVTEFAKLCGVTPRTIKYYEELGLFCPEKVESNGYRVYNAGQMDEISAIRLFKEHGLSLKEIREIVACNDTDGMIRRLNRQQEILAERILHLNRQQRIVEESLFHLERAKEHGTEPFVEQLDQRIRKNSLSEEPSIVNYLSLGIRNGAILGVPGGKLKETYQVTEEGDIHLEGKCVTLYCSTAPDAGKAALRALIRRAGEEHLAAEEIYCEEIMEGAGDRQGLFRYFVL